MNRRVAAISLLAFGCVAADSGPEPIWIDQAIRWSKTPILVAWDDRFPSQGAAIQMAMFTWNNAVGCDLFKAAGPLDFPFVHVHHPSRPALPCGDPTSDTPSSEALAITYLCDPMAACVQVYRPEAIGNVSVMTHELGHVLGLAHDPTGLMAEVTSGALLPSDVDREALRERYCAGSLD